ncbi:MAG: hypothetical protein A2Z14_05380 [Chloroflexi bacterium RBG_16_48_8]|nr:MAG: hypothetical protein A2Z14_05380 [Chloroflexi bacterium RBG_16_48_8]
MDVDGLKLLVDPFITDNPAASVKVEDLEADFILISHGHGDHVGDAVSIAKRTGALVISNFEIASWFEKKGIQAHGHHIGGGFRPPSSVPPPLFKDAGKRVPIRSACHATDPTMV